MTSELSILAVTAATVGLTHTLVGIDHTLPFVVLGRAQGWRASRVLGLTVLCGLGHILSSVLLGAIGIRLGLAVQRMNDWEAARGDWAAWALMAFGTAYAAWSFGRERRRQRHLHEHGGGMVHAHATSEALHPHAQGGLSPRALTAWGLFIVFVLGPCEPLIPLLIVPALDHGIAASAGIALIFGATTLATMLTVVAAGYWGLGTVAFRRLEPYANTLAGLAIALSGIAIQTLGI